MLECQANVAHKALRTLPGALSIAISNCCKVSDKRRVLKKLDTSRVIGITGKTGSGKTTTAKLLGELTGFHVIHGDKYVQKLLHTTPIKQIVELQLKRKLTLTSHDAELLKQDQLYEGTNAIINDKSSKLKRIQGFGALFLITQLLKKELKALNGEPTIVELVGLPGIHIAKTFAENNFMEGDDDLRFQKISERDNISIEAAKQIDSYYNGIVNFNKLKYSRIFRHNYQPVPGLEQYAKELIERFS